MCLLITPLAALRRSPGVHLSLVVQAASMPQAPWGLRSGGNHIPILERFELVSATFDQRNHPSPAAPGNPQEGPLATTPHLRPASWETQKTRKQHKQRCAV